MQVSADYAKKLKELRYHMGKITQAELASMIGAERGALSQWENGRSEPREPHRSRLEALGLGKSPEEWPFFIRIRATPQQIKLLVDILADPNISTDNRAAVRAELLKALSIQI